MRLTLARLDLSVGRARRAVPIIAAVPCAALIAATGPFGQPITFNRDVLPILQKNCQTCHRLGEMGPMPLMTYEDARPYARAIKAAVVSRRMPPWFADTQFGHFKNERRLSDADVNTLAAWADNGASKGSSPAEPGPAFIEGWNIKPDILLEMPKAYDIPASGVVPYTYFVVPTHFDHDVWITAAEVRPSNRAVVHHLIVSARPPGSSYLARAKVGEPFVPTSAERSKRPDGSGTEFLASYNPGMGPYHFDIATSDTARMIPAHSDLIFEVHYTPNGKPMRDQSQIGLTVATRVPKHVYYTFSVAPPNSALVIPPGDPDYQASGTVLLTQPVQLVWMFPHMHVRGKDFRYEVLYPTGARDTLLNVPKYDFGWQAGYEESAPVALPKGTRIEAIAHFDNSPANKNNPDPRATVHWGDQTWDEMMLGWFAIVVDSTLSPQGLVTIPSRVPGLDWLRSLRPTKPGHDRSAISVR
jgi:hypothetical protein